MKFQNYKKKNTKNNYQQLKIDALLLHFKHAHDKTYKIQTFTVQQFGYLNKIKYIKIFNKEKIPVEAQQKQNF